MPGYSEWYIPYIWRRYSSRAAAHSHSRYYVVAVYCCCNAALHISPERQLCLILPSNVLCSMYHQVHT
jgi:hypothetical protein